MKRKKSTLLIAGIVGGNVMTGAIFGHKKVHAELVIPAPPATIWAVLTDAPRYKEWNPVFVNVTGEHKEGATLTYQMKGQSGKVSSVTAKINKLVFEREINQGGGIPGILTFDHHWVLEPVDGGTKVTQWEQYRGVGVWFWDPSWFEGQYQEAIESLRDRVMNQPDTGEGK